MNRLKKYDKIKNSILVKTGTCDLYLTHDWSTLQESEQLRASQAMSAEQASTEETTVSGQGVKTNVGNIANAYLIWH